MECCSRTRTDSTELQEEGLAVEKVGIIPSFLHLQKHKPVSGERICTVCQTLEKGLERSYWLLDLQFHFTIDKPCSFCSRTPEHHLIISPIVQVTSDDPSTISISMHSSKYPSPNRNQSSHQAHSSSTCNLVSGRRMGDGRAGSRWGGRRIDDRGVTQDRRRRSNWFQGGRDRLEWVESTLCVQNVSDGAVGDCHRRFRQDGSWIEQGESWNDD